MSIPSVASVGSEPGRASHRSLSLRAAFGVALLVTVVLAALAFWPKKAWVPPRRPGLTAPVVFDEFVNPPPPALADPSAPDPAAH